MGVRCLRLARERGLDMWLGARGHWQQRQCIGSNQTVGGHRLFGLRPRRCWQALAPGTTVGVSRREQMHVSSTVTTTTTTRKRRRQPTKTTRVVLVLAVSQKTTTTTTTRQSCRQERHGLRELKYAPFRTSRKLENPFL